MRKFRLIKNYPDSLLEVGEILIFNEYQKVVVKSINNYDYEYSLQNCIEYPEFWEEIIEIDYEILCLQSSIANQFLQLTDIERNQYLEGSAFKNCSIYSVKRISDNTVFKIGDFCHIQFSGCSGEKFIKSFYIDNNRQLKVVFAGVESSLKHLTRKDYKPYLFRTLDGTDIKEGEEYYALFHNFTYLKQEAIDNYTLDNAEYRFHLRKNCEQYITMNKPCLSINDVINAFGKGINPLPLIAIVDGKAKD